MANLALAFDILARDKGASKTFKDVGDAADDAGKRGGKIGAAIGAGVAVAGAGLLALGKTAISAGSDLSETVNKSTVVFGKNAAEAVAWSKTSARSFGLSQQASLAAASQFGDMFQQLGFTGDAALDNSKSLVKMAGDLGSFHNVDPTDVLDRIGGALRGEYDSLQQLIPNINAARVEQEALAATGKQSAKDLTAAEKATAVLAIVQKDGAAAAGDFAETSGGLANQQRILKAEFENIQASLGQKLLPALTTLGGVLLSTIDFVDRNSAVIVPLVAVLGTLAGVIWAVTTAAKVYTAVQAALNIVMALNPIGLVVIAIAALVAGFVIAWKHSETFRNVVMGAFGGVRTAAGWVVDAVKWIVSAIASIPRSIGDVFGGLWASFKGAVNRIVGAWNNLYFEIGGGNFFGLNVPRFRLDTPNIPYLARGGVVKASPGGTLAVIGEGGHDEAVVPLSGPHAPRGGGVTIIVQGDVISEDRLLTKIRTGLQDQQRRGVQLGFVS